MHGIHACVCVCVCDMSGMFAFVYGCVLCICYV